MPLRYTEEKRLAILADYKAGPLSIPEICVKHCVGKNTPRELARAENLRRRSTRLPSTRAPRKARTASRRVTPSLFRNGQWKPRGTSRAEPKYTNAARKPPKMDREAWLAACAKRTKYLREVGPYPERVLYPERYGGQARFVEDRNVGSQIVGILNARERADAVNE